MFHKAISLSLKEGTALEVTFQSGEVKHYDMSALFQKYPQLKALEDRDLFLKGKLMGNYGIIWNEELDIEVETIYEDGQLVNIETLPAVMIIANAIFEARVRTGMSQKDLSAATGIDQSDISKIERGAANPTLGTLSRIADALGTRLVVSLETVA